MPWRQTTPMDEKTRFIADQQIASEAAPRRKTGQTGAWRT